MIDNDRLYKECIKTPYPWDTMNVGDSFLVLKMPSEGRLLADAKHSLKRNRKFKAERVLHNVQRITRIE